MKMKIACYKKWREKEINKSMKEIEETASCLKGQKGRGKKGRRFGIMICRSAASPNCPFGRQQSHTSWPYILRLRSACSGRSEPVPVWENITTVTQLSTTSTLCMWHDILLLVLLVCLLLHVMWWGQEIYRQSNILRVSYTRWLHTPLWNAMILAK